MRNHTGAIIVVIAAFGSSGPQQCLELILASLTIGQSRHKLSVLSIYSYRHFFCSGQNCHCDRYPNDFDNNISKIGLPRAFKQGKITLISHIKNTGISGTPHSYIIALPVYSTMTAVPAPTSNTSIRQSVFREVNAKTN